jgi:methylated-DNA-[protein]-cysteine S-methyltransferase
MTQIRYEWTESPIGRLLLVAGDAGLRAIGFEGAQPRPEWRRQDGSLSEAARQLEAYFAGELREFDLALDPQGTTFQRHVWKELRRIPFGGSTTYAEMARRIGRPRAVRAVGAANGRNPLPIVIPCHRVIGSDGSLTGYAGGLPIKEFLLRFEGSCGAQLTFERSAPVSR